MTMKHRQRRGDGGWAGSSCCARGCCACCCAPTSRWCSQRVCPIKRKLSRQGVRPVARSREAPRNRGRSSL